MNVNAVSFKSGFIYNGEDYINPDAIGRISKRSEKNKNACVMYTDGTKENFNVSVDTFVAAATQAKNSDDIVDISK